MQDHGLRCLSLPNALPQSSAVKSAATPFAQDSRGSGIWQGVRRRSAPRNINGGSFSRFSWPVAKLEVLEWSQSHGEQSIPPAGWELSWGCQRGRLGSPTSGMLPMAAGVQGGTFQDEKEDIADPISIGAGLGRYSVPSSTFCWSKGSS